MQGTRRFQKKDVSGRLTPVDALSTAAAVSIYTQLSSALSVVYLFNLLRGSFAERKSMGTHMEPSPLLIYPPPFPFFSLHCLSSLSFHPLFSLLPFPPTGLLPIEVGPSLRLGDLEERLKVFAEFQAKNRASCSNGVEELFRKYHYAIGHER